MTALLVSVDQVTLKPRVTAHACMQELCLRPNLDSNGSTSPDAAMMAKAAQHSVDSGRGSVLANVARQPALRMYDPSYVAALANATQRHSH